MILSTEMQAKIDEINTASMEIPFGNSEFQNLNFVLNAEITPERAYRHCLLRLHNRISALRECYYNLKLEDIDIEEMEAKIADPETSSFNKRREEIKLDQKRSNRVTTEKMVSDCLEEINTLYGAFTKLPKYSRLEFEAGERKHFELKLAKDAMIAMQCGGAAGAMTSLDNMGSSVWMAGMFNNPEALQTEIDGLRNTVLQLK